MQPALAGSFPFHASSEGFGLAVVLAQPYMTFMSLESSHDSASLSPCSEVIFLLNFSFGSSCFILEQVFMTLLLVLSRSPSS